VTATDNEYTAIVNNNTYRLVPLPKDRKSVTTKWIYKIKYNADGTVDYYKAHWVARGFTQLKGIDYYKTASPVVRMENLCLVTGHERIPAEKKSLPPQGKHSHEVHWSLSLSAGGCPQ